MATVTIWEGYRSTVGDYVTYVEFDAEHIGGVSYRIDDCDIDYSFYRANGGQVVVHETRSIEYGALGNLYGHTQAAIYLYSTITEACRNLDVIPHSIDPHRRNAAVSRGGEIKGRVITLEQYIAEVFA